jgi:Lon protease-like protein
MKASITFELTDESAAQPLTVVSRLELSLPYQQAEFMDALEQLMSNQLAATLMACATEMSATRESRAAELKKEADAQVADAPQAEVPPVS